MHFAVPRTSVCCSFLPDAHESIPPTFLLTSLTPVPSSFFFQRFPALTFFSFSPPSGLFFCLPAKHLFLSFCSSALWYVNHKRFLPPHHTDASTESTTCTEQIVSARSVLRPAANRAYFWKKQLEGKTHRRCSPTPGAGSGALLPCAKCSHVCKSWGSEANCAFFSKLNSQNNRLNHAWTSAQVKSHWNIRLKQGQVSP